MAKQDEPACKRVKVHDQTLDESGAADAEGCQLDRLPPELFINCISTLLAPEDLCALLTASTKTKALLTDPANDIIWGDIARSLWESPLLQDAAAAAGSYRSFVLQKRRHVQQSLADWKTPCEYEMQASLHRIAAAAATTTATSPTSTPRPTLKTSPDISSKTPCDSPTSASTVFHNSLGSSTPTSRHASSRSYSGSSDSEVMQGRPAPDISAQSPDSPGCSSASTSSGGLPGAPGAYIVFLVDGSGSVGDEEFAASTSFIARAAADAKTRTGQPCKVAVMQFSNDVRTEWEDGSTACTDDINAFKATIQSMVRMNGGTNIAAALTHAGKVLKRDAGPDMAKVIVLITDGRVDGYQAKEARHVAAMLCDEQPHTTMFAYGVGRGVDRAELLAIIGAARPSKGCMFQDPEARYLDLFHREEAPW